MGALNCCDKKKPSKNKRKDQDINNKKTIFHCNKPGQKKDADQTDQDSWDIISTEFQAPLRYLAVYDGHGLKGKEASNLAKDEIRKALLNDKKTLLGLKERKEAEKYFKKLFKNVQNKFKKKNQDFDSSGTCVISVLINDSSCFIINLGDSRAVIGSRQGSQKIAYQMSIDHKANREDERQRIEKNGGYVSDEKTGGGPSRVYSRNEEGLGLAVSRSLGDLFGHSVGVSEEPEISYKDIDGDDKFVVIGSDGIWDVMNSAEAVGLVFEKIQENPTQNKDKVSESLVVECRNRWEVINMYKQKLLNDKNNKDGNQAKSTTQNIMSNFTIDDITAVICYFYDVV
jgi:integrin-linked kinase-associated serine/threonine phosphatase 2C